MQVLKIRGYKFQSVLLSNTVNCHVTVVCMLIGFFLFKHSFECF